MSMRLNLAKIEAALLESVRADPALIGTILVNDGQSHAGFSRETDMFAADYRILTAIAEGRAEAEHATTKWRRCYPWLATATGENGENDIEGYEFGYGPAFVLDPVQVTAVAEGLAGERWGSGAGFEVLVAFYAAAAREGKAVVGGVN
ncbi:hypothetical protein ACIBI9_58590 [Nonomuraea sp. NPDC050451]|uniref:hypothetical protein n=1 Tax=Nonomuraea sp. NPDC050451 TaxID=3364364 RepID=UPI00379EC1C2